LREPKAPNELWAIDFKGWFRVGDGARCDPFTVTDAHSRYLLCCDAHEEQFGEPVWRSLVRTFREHGLPDAIRMDNGQPWVSTKGELGLTTLSVKFLKLGIDIERIAKGKPQQNGRHERFHLTLQTDVTRSPAATIRAQQVRFDRYRQVFNHERPHEALGQRPPASVHAPSMRQYPGRLPTIDYPGHFETRVVLPIGRVSYKGTQYFISTALSGERIALYEIDEDCFEVYFGRLALGRIHARHPELGLVLAK